MRINGEAQAPPQPVRERQPAEETRERTVRAQEKPQEPPKPEGMVGRNLDIQA